MIQERANICELIVINGNTSNVMVANRYSQSNAMAQSNNANAYVGYNSQSGASSNTLPPFAQRCMVPSNYAPTSFQSTRGGGEAQCRVPAHGTFEVPPGGLARTTSAHQRPTQYVQTSQHSLNNPTYVNDGAPRHDYPYDRNM